MRVFNQKFELTNLNNYTHPTLHCSSWSQLDRTPPRLIAWSVDFHHLKELFSCLLWLSPRSSKPFNCSTRSLKDSTNHLLLIHGSFIVWIPYFLWDFVRFPHSSRPLLPDLLKHPLLSSECPLDMSPWQSLCLLHRPGPHVPTAPNFILVVVCGQEYICTTQRSMAKHSQASNLWRLSVEQELSVQWEHNRDFLLKDYSNSPAASWGPIFGRRSADIADKTNVTLVTFSRGYLQANFLSSCFLGNILWSRLSFPVEKTNHAQKLL